MQSWRALMRVPVTAPRAAASRSASSKTTKGALPHLPLYRERGWSPYSRAIRSPTGRPCAWPTDRALHVHERLIDAILGGDPDAIAAEVERHAQASADYLLEMIAERKRGGGDSPA
jgi:hypothetical protein